MARNNREKTVFAVKTIRKIIDYEKSHMSVGMIGTGIAMFLAAIMLSQGFLQQEYLKYLLAETTKTELAVLETTSLNLNSALRDAVMIGADIAIDNDLERFVDAVLDEKGSKYRPIQRLKSRMNSVTHFRGNIAATTIVTEDGLLCEYGRYWNDSGYSNLWTDESLNTLSALYDAVLERAKAKMVVSYQCATEPMTHENFPEMTFFHLAFPLLGDKVHREECRAVVVLTVRLDSMIKIQTDAKNKNQDYISEYITDADNKVIFHTGEDNSGQKADVLPHKGHKGTEELHVPLNYFGWTIHSDIDTTQMKQVVQRMFRQAVWAYLVLLLLCIVIWQLVLWKILQPLNYIGKAMGEIQSGNYSGKIKIQGKHELWQLAEKYNNTVEALEEQREATKREFEEKTETMQRCSAAEKEALESQINAHFLCNTLNAINYSAMENGDTEVSVLLKNLSGILYYTFAPETKAVTLGEEIDWVCQYLYLQKYRLMDVFDYEIIIPEEYMEWPCCKLFLQPFVENSILHGFEGWERGGEIRIEASESQGRLVIAIKDNGRGMDGEVRDDIRKVLEDSPTQAEEAAHMGIGIRNVIARLRMYYGPDLEMHLDSELGKGTCFTMWLPIPADLLDEENESEEADVL